MSNSSDKKGRGLFGRLFGGNQPAEPTAPADPQEESSSSTTEPESKIAVEPSADLETATTTIDTVDTQPADNDALPSNAVESAEPDVSSEPEPQPDPAPANVPAKKSWFGRLRDGLDRTSNKLSDGITGLFTKSRLDATTLDDLEDLLIQSDIGIPMAQRISTAIGAGRYEKGISPDAVRAILAAEVENVLTPVAQPLVVDPTHKPHVILMVGVNGAGKTTTIGKLATQFKSEGRSVMLAAGDTFRAAAIDQLKVWGERTDCPVVARPVGADAAGLAFDALQEAKQSGTDVLLLDTAGRLQNKQGLMDELAKMIKVLKKQDSEAPHDVILVLDATTGQNALSQVEVFREIAGVTGLIMTKLDGTARGGILVAIAEKTGLPVHAIGVGESADDMQPFAAAEFARAIARI